MSACRDVGVFSSFLVGGTEIYCSRERGSAMSDARYGGFRVVYFGVIPGRRRLNFSLCVTTHHNQHAKTLFFCSIFLPPGTESLRSPLICFLPLQLSTLNPFSVLCLLKMASCAVRSLHHCLDSTVQISKPYLASCLHALRYPDTQGMCNYVSH